MSDQLPILRSQYSHLLPHVVRWGDVDMLGHVNNVQYFRFAEEARVTWISKIVPNPTELFSGEGLILADIQCQFIRQLRWPVTIEVGSRVVKMGRSSMTILNPIFEQAVAAPAAVARAVVVWFDYQAQCSKPIPESVRVAIRAFETLKPIE